jgi:hypothetical protein
MASSNVERLRAAYEDLAARGEWPEEPPLLGPGFELHQDPVLDNAKVFRGPDAAAALMELTGQSISELTVEAERFIEAPSGEIAVVVRTSGRGRASGIAIDRHQAHVWRFEGPEPRQMVVHGRADEALRKLGLDS